MKTPVAGPSAGRNSHLVPEGSAGARVLPVPPPLLYSVPMAAGLAINRVVPLSIGAPGSQAAEAILVVVGFGVAAAGAAAVVRHQTTIVPHRAVSTLVTGGVYRFTRNPMYAGLAVAYVGGSLLARSWWPLALLLPALIVLQRFAIGPEERYLSARFGGRYDAYRSRVRRCRRVALKTSSIRRFSVSVSAVNWVMPLSGA
jgi:protein-S-isoprenylcysteine O-methyltransferase Ste14